MPRALGIAANCASKSGGSLCSDNAASVRLSSALAAKAEAIFDKPYRALVDTLHISERDAHYRLSSKPETQRKFNALEVARLLQSEQGIHFLVVLMDKKRPRWWKAVLKMGILGSLEQRRLADLELFRKVFHADTTAATEFSAAFRVQDPDFYGAVLAGHDEAVSAGISTRAVAPPKERRR